MALLYISTIIIQLSNADTAFWQLDSVYFSYHVVLSESLFPSPTHDSLFMDGAMSESPDRTLKVSGVKDFSFDINEGFDQGLKVNINGRIEDVSIEGNLSDQATPSPTTRISDIEKMNLIAFTDNFYGGIGNLTLDLPFAVHDEIEGGRIRLHDRGKNNAAGVSYAQNRGRYRKTEFSGEEGKQGPYFLNGKVIYGSEKVFLAQGMNPAQMLRCDDDYNVDYEQGIVVFTNKNIITTRSRISVEYQEAAEEYSSIYQEGDAQVRYSDFVVNTLLRRVYDEKGRPLTFTLSPAEVESLKLSGDSAQVAHTFADTSSSGSYHLSSGHFIYTGEGNGDYNVTFFYVGENNGEYVYDPVINGFSYQGPGLGNYSPDKYIPLPEDNQFYAVGVASSYGLALSLYGSQSDRNTFSTFGDEDNSAKGYHVKAQKDFQYIGAEAEYINYDMNLIMPMGREDIDYRSYWNTSETLEEMAKFRSTIKPMPMLAFELGYGILNRAHYHKAITIRPLFFYFGYENVDTLDKYFCGLSRELKKISISSGYEKLENGHHVEYAAAYTLNSSLKLGISGDYDQEFDDRAVTTKLNFLSVPLSLFIGHRFYNDTILFFTNGQANFRLGDFTCHGEFQQSQRYSQVRDETFVKVSAGAGNYVYDSVTNSYLQKKGGDYIKKTFLLQDFQRVVTHSYGLDAAYAKGIFNLGGRFNYIDEENFLGHFEDLLVAASKNDYRLEVDLQQDVSEDGRYALEMISTRSRSLSLNPSYRNFYSYSSVKESHERTGIVLREKRTDYNSELDCEIIEDPQVKPYIAYGYSSLYSEYFEGMDLRLQTPRVGLVFAKPVKNKGRAEINGELLYRRFNMENVPYFYTAAEPAGLTKVIGLTVSFGLGDNTVFNLLYRIQFPAGERYYQNLKFQTRIKF